MWGDLCFTRCFVYDDVGVCVVILGRHVLFVCGVLSTCVFVVILSL